MFLIFLCLLATSVVFLIANAYIKITKSVPANGGSYIEGTIGQPRFINPIYGETNDIDRDLIELTFSGLMSYDNQGKLVTDLAKEYKVSEDGRIYEFTLKDNIFWHDGKPLTSEDIVFTIRTIQNSDYKSPLRANWLDVDTEIISEKSLRFKLKSPYNGFLENCTVKIIPRHVWENILPENFSLSFYNLQPVGTGPYKFKSLQQTDTGFVKSIILKANTNYYKSTTHISEITFNFYEGKGDLLKAAQKKEINGFSYSSLNGDSYSVRGFNSYSFRSPRYFSIFFNTAKGDIMPDLNVRQALNYATNKQAIVDAIGGKNKQAFQVIDSPILPEFFGYNQPTTIYSFDIEKAKELLDKAGFKEIDGKRIKAINKKPAFQFVSALAFGSRGTEVEELQKCLLRDPEIYQGDVTGYYGNATKEAVTKFQQKYLPDLEAKYIGSVGKSTRIKLNELCTPPAQNTLPLELTITTINQPTLVQVAEIVKAQWESIGATVEIKALSIQDLKDAIKDRTYDLLLYGEALEMSLDPYPFWHSSQKVDPGLNLTGFDNADADRLLKEARETLDETIKQDDYQELQDVIVAEAPAIFLYNSGYIYFVGGKIKGIDTQKIVDPAKRFANVEDWYIKTKRTWK